MSFITCSSNTIGSQPGIFNTIDDPVYIAYTGPVKDFDIPEPGSWRYTFVGKAYDVPRRRCCTGIGNSPSYNAGVGVVQEAKLGYGYIIQVPALALRGSHV